MKVDKVYCLFEQSGTFKKAFRELNIEAEDYDILNDFGETDCQIDLFSEIERAYEGDSSIFDNMKPNDLCLAFFPCTRFECIIPLAFRGEQLQQQDWSDEKKLEYSMQLHTELHRLYSLLCKLFTVAIRKNIRLVIENPYTQPHYLTMFFPVKPKVIIKDRTEEGDYYRKPTQFFFVNCEPEQNIIFEPIEYVKQMRIDQLNQDRCPDSNYTTQVQRSLIHPQFALRFIKTYLLDVDGGYWI